MNKYYISKGDKTYNSFRYELAEIKKASAAKKKKAAKEKKNREILKIKESSCVVYKTANIPPSFAEKRISEHLESLGICFEREVSFKGFTNQKDCKLRFDFYLPTKSIIIEYDGKGYHTSPTAKANDKLKNIFCRIHSFKLLRLNSRNWHNLESVISSFVQG